MFLAIIGVIGLVVAIVLAIVAFFKMVTWKAVGWTAGASLLAIVVGAAIGGGTPGGSPGGNPGSSGTAAPVSNSASESGKAPDSAQSPGSEPAKPPAPAPAPEKPKPPLEVVEVHQEPDQFGGGYAAGTVKNNSNRKYGYVQVEINLYDADGNQVGSTLANTNNLEPGATWKFRAPVFEENAKKFKVVDVTGF